MQDLIASIPVILVTLILVVAIFWFTGRAKKQKEKELMQFVLERGWLFEPIREPLAWGFRIKGQQWTYEVLSRSSGQTPESGSSNISQNTRWWTEKISLSGHLVLIAPLSKGYAYPGLENQAKQQVLHLFASEPGEPLIESVIYEHYLSLANDPADIQALINPRAGNNLKNWAGQPFKVTYSSQGLKIEIPGQRIEKPLEIIRLVELGESFLDLP